MGWAFFCFFTQGIRGSYSYLGKKRNGFQDSGVVSFYRHISVKPAGKVSRSLPILVNTQDDNLLLLSVKMLVQMAEICSGYKGSYSADDLWELNLMRYMHCSLNVAFVTRLNIQLGTVKPDSQKCSEHRKELADKHGMLNTLGKKLDP